MDTTDISLPCADDLMGICDALQFIHTKKRVKVKQSNYRLGQALRVPWRLRLTDLKTIVHLNLVRLSALLTGRFYTPGNIPGTHFSYRPSVGHSAAGRIMLTL
jgi:hypothetical protein